MPYYRALVSTYKPTELAKDWITNTVYFEDHGVGTNADAIAQDVANVFATFRDLPLGFTGVKVKLYDMAEPQPREIQAEKNATGAAGPSPTGPREVALCLSFHGAQNVPRKRGRIYIGPWVKDRLNERPGEPAITALQTLAGQLADIGGMDVDWSVFSPTASRAAGWTDTGGGTPIYYPIQGAWVDDEWDTQRSRGLRLTTRNVVPISE